MEERSIVKPCTRIFAKPARYLFYLRTAPSNTRLWVAMRLWGPVVDAYARDIIDIET
jgi:hypothetical protein